MVGQTKNSGKMVLVQDSTFLVHSLVSEPGPNLMPGVTVSKDHGPNTTGSILGTAVFSEIFLSVGRQSLSCRSSLRHRANFEDGRNVLLHRGDLGPSGCLNWRTDWG